MSSPPISPTGPPIARFCGELTARFGAPDVIVNNASVFEHDFPGQADPEKLAASLSVHVAGALFDHRGGGQGEKAGRRVSVFNILDHKLLNLNPDYYSYTLGKSALMALTEIWRRAERPDIRVFGLLPGLMFPSGPQTEERFPGGFRKIPTGRATPRRACLRARSVFSSTIPTCRRKCCRSTAANICPAPPRCRLRVIFRL